MNLRPAPPELAERLVTWWPKHEAQHDRVRAELRRPQWSEARVERLTQMWRAGNSAAEIATALGEGVTWKAVNAKARRLGLPARVHPPKARPRISHWYHKEQVRLSNDARDADLIAQHLADKGVTTCPSAPAFGSVEPAYIGAGGSGRGKSR